MQSKCKFVKPANEFSKKFTLLLGLSTESRNNELKVYFNHGGSETQKSTKNLPASPCHRASVVHGFSSIVPAGNNYSRQAACPRQGK